ncbi:ABC transporter ATP-binding protein [Sediminicoccus sp. KRV36]|uniref:ABC transporter ATP-binding protein n=1 Tax=Sediminicoccus sp. KRV36 TaxID=3133721 RepID=UPI00200E7174|nr:ABC transporter ATP-binding protein [Sediminicoccus rosea]UPY38174.1 ABC transporter ATP-binding protein [Sediminicoccus rosea]
MSEAPSATSPAPAGLGDFAIRADNVSKVYPLYPDRSARVMEALTPWAGPRHTDFRALDHVSFEVPRGATLGILGVNGSGKSTLLQIIGGIIPPSSGRLEVNGRIAALIELGAGFNPDMTGRENVRVNGVIMGLTQAEVEARMPLIEAFADIGQFFDQPVKTHSSGMMARVAFAMAVHVDPDILIIDEALAVGDARFQQKCFRRFRDFQDAGKTILLVTHDRFSVPRLCTHGMLLHRGELMHFGAADRAAQLYGEILTRGDDDFSAAGEDEIRLDDTAVGEAPKPPAAAVTLSMDEDADAALARFLAAAPGEDRVAANRLYNPGEFRTGDGEARITDLLLLANGAANPDSVMAGETLSLLVRIEADQRLDLPNLGLVFRAKDGVLVFETNALWQASHLAMVPAGASRVYRMDVEARLGAGDWFVDVALASGTDLLHDQRLAVLHVHGRTPTPSHGLACFATRITELPTP